MVNYKYNHTIKSGLNFGSFQQFLKKESIGLSQLGLVLFKIENRHERKIIKVKRFL